MKLNADAPPCAGPDRAPRAPRQAVPPGAADCHAHVFGDPRRFPFASPRAYTPPLCTTEDYLEMLDATGLRYGVVVQPSVYGQDNAALLDALKRGNGRLRGIIDPAADDLEASRLHELSDLGVRGIRINMLARGDVSGGEMRELAERLAPAGWHIDIIPDGIGRVAELAEIIPTLPVPVVIEQMGRIAGDQSPEEPGFAALCRLVAEEAAWVKLSHGYHISAEGPPYADTLPFARALCEAGPTRLVWGSDWPHPMLDGPMPNDGALLDLLADWAPDSALRRRILVDNPAALYGFPDPFETA
ncbi:MAG: amidohydrolase family protein [Rhodovibrionaceae bacterium]